MVRHRAGIAGLGADTFDTAALKAIYKASRGVPRIVNVVCDRALLAAFAANQNHVDRRLAQQAGREALAGPGAPPPRTRALVVVATLATIAIAGAGWLGTQPVAEHWAQRAAALYRQAGLPLLAGKPAVKAPTAPAPKLPVEASAVPAQAEKSADSAPVAKIAAPTTAAEPEPEPAPIEPEAAAATAAAAPEAPLQGTADKPLEPVVMEETAAPDPTPEPAAENATAAKTEPEPKPPAATAATPPATPPPPLTLAGLLDQARATGPATALASERSLLALWQHERTRLTAGGLCPAAEAAGLICLDGEGNWWSLRLLNRPALIPLRHGTGQVLALVEELDGERARIRLNGQTVRVSRGDLEAAWQGHFRILWQPPPFPYRLLRRGMRGDDVAWFRERFARVLKRLDTSQPAEHYDAELRRRVVEFQRTGGLQVDGVIGAWTIVRLTSALEPARVPLLNTALAHYAVEEG